MLKKTVFLDRDGVINQDSPDYVRSCAEFQFLPGSLEALLRLTENSFSIIIITNQSGVNRNIIPQETLDEIHKKMQRAVIDHGGLIKDIFFCPHHPKENCDCRKPKPGMIIQARKRYHIDLSSAYMVGDSVKDMECARNAGCRFAVLVRTGNGSEAEKILLESETPPDHVAENLLDAVGWIITHHHRLSITHS